MDYFLYKKLVMCAFWASTFFVGLGIRHIFDRVLPLVTGTIGLIGIILIAVFSTDLIMFKSLYSYWYVSQLVNVAVWLYVIGRYLRYNVEARVFFTGFVVLFLYSGMNAVFDWSGVFFAMNSTILYTSVFSIMPLMLVYLDFTKNRQELHEETMLKEEAYQKAVTDGLTGAYNKHHLLTVLKEIEPGYTIAMFDIDNFKEINDRFGHQGGDRALKFITHELQTHLRDEDQIYRYGGDEFVIIMDCPLAIVNQRMEDFRKLIASAQVHYGDQIMQMTLSIGLYYVTGHLDDHGILDAVDKALYVSKGTGKNKVTIYRETVGGTNAE